MKISYTLPTSILDNNEFIKYGWPVQKIFEKTGINQRHIASKDQFALDLAVSACKQLFTEYNEKADSIDYLLYCTQSPDFFVPNNASILQDRLSLSRNVGSIDINQGCTGFIYGLSLAKGLLLSNQAANVLLVTADTWSKYISKDDKSTRSIFGDGAAATLLTLADAQKIGSFIFGTDGSGAHNIMVKTSGLRHKKSANCSLDLLNEPTNGQGDDSLVMNGPDVFTFTIQNVPPLVQNLLLKSNISMQEIDHFVFHQANGYMLEHLRKKLAIPKDKFHVYLENVGNTVSSSIPIVLKNLYAKNMIRQRQRIMLVGFGVGYSWIGTIMTV